MENKQIFAKGDLISIVQDQHEIIDQVCFVFFDRYATQYFHTLLGVRNVNTRKTSVTLIKKGNHMNVQELTNLTKSELNNVLEAKYSDSQLKNITKETMITEIVEKFPEPQPHKKSEKKQRNFRDAALEILTKNSGMEIADVAAEIAKTEPDLFSGSYMYKDKVNFPKVISFIKYAIENKQGCFKNYEG